MWRWNWRAFWLTLPVTFTVLLAVGGVLVVIGFILSFLNWGLPVPVLGQITEFLLGVPFHPKAGPRGDYSWGALAMSAAMNIATWATLGSLLAGAVAAALAGFRHRQAGAA